MNIEIVELDINNLELLKESLNIMNRTQGDGLFNEDYLVKKARSTDGVVLCAFLKNKLVGVGCAELINDLDYYKPFDNNIVERLKNKKVGSLCSLSVHEDFQGKGIGQMIARKCLDWLKSRGCDLVLGLSWVSGLPHTSNRVFQKIGFQVIKEVKEFYKEGATKHPFNCPGCKTQPCICSAVLYEYHFNGRQAVQ
ncbi:MAG: GNAT family N-acetyltransferase [Proteobacteria bacterium]|nr:GNAT family N-acetyltransferase [Pseudomonadota bacterium]